MATMSITNEGELALANRAFGKQPAGDLTVKLYITNDIVSGEDATNASFTECTAINYTPQTVTPADITVSYISASGYSDAVFTANFANLTASPDQTVYGAYVVDVNNDVIAYARYDVAKVIGGEPQTLNHTFTIRVS